MALAMPMALAQPKAFIREYTYKAGETDSKISSRQKALTEVKALLIEELGVYVESYVNHTVTEENGVITKEFFRNEIKTLGMGTTETKILEERWDGYEYYIKAEIRADPEEVVRRINQTLSARRSSEAADSLKLLLQNSNQELTAKNKELLALRSQLDAQERKIDSTQTTLNTLNTQLIESNRRLATFEAQEKRILTEIGAIEQKMKDASAKARANVRLGMTTEEVIQVCGQPRSISLDHFNYGDVWVIINDGIVTGMVYAKDFYAPRNMESYRNNGVKNLLTK
jgi:chromosome segregation ATPase